MKADLGLVPDITPALFFAHGENTPTERGDTFAAPATTPWAPGSPNIATSPPTTGSTRPAPTPSPPSPPTGVSRTARTGIANTTCCAPTSPPAPTRPPSPPTPSWPG
ncbi:hypothetical protein ACWGKW_44150 [Streptomyces sp. NPDC054766]